ncbi:MAG: tyrosine-type recombinase/integrase [Pirellulaceae bacterium]
MSDSNNPRPAKPYPEFPMYPHRNGQWCRKINGKNYYFGLWEDPNGSLDRHNKEYPYLKAGVPVPVELNLLTIGDGVNLFLQHKDEERRAGIITNRWFQDLCVIGKFIVENLDRRRAVESLTPNDFADIRSKIVRKHSPSISRNWIARIKSVFKYLWDSRLIRTPVNFGVAFKPPSKMHVRKHRAEKGKQLWTAEQIKSLLAVANPTMRAMMLIAINTGCNNSDIRSMPIKAFDLDNGWMDFPRAKTFVDRRVPLWPETIQAIKDYLEIRPRFDSEKLSKLLFVTRWGRDWSPFAINNEMKKLKAICRIDKGSFIWFRKTVQTIGERCGDIIAVRSIMGHVDGSISDHYRQEINDARLTKVTDEIRNWMEF